MFKHKYLVGDIVTIKAPIVEINVNSLSWPYQIDVQGDNVSIREDSILAVESRSIILGDYVRLKDYSGGYIYQVVAIDGDDAWLSYTENGYKKHATCKLSYYERI